ncbi:MAG: hypothetical protein AB8F34_00200 [Akkermansiaceae bacterium]
MNRFITPGIILALTYAATADPENTSSETDLLRFSDKANNDTLHGKFLSFGKSGNIVFKSTEAIEPTTFSTEKLHRITLAKGRAEQALSPSAVITLINGDVIPGKVISVDSKAVTLDTQHIGQLSIPADAVSIISPSPHGGKLLYYGPMNADGWKTITMPKKKAEADDKKEEEKEKAPQEKKPEGDKKEESKPTDWKLVAGAWYAGTEKERYLVRENALTDTCKIKFKLGWRGSLYCNVGLHADLNPPENEAEAATSRTNMAATLGKSYVISLSSHSASLYQCSFDEDGKPETNRVGQNHVSMNLSRSDEAEVEIRIDRPNNTLMLYVDGAFKIKWDLGEKYTAPGNALAFKNLRYSNSEMRVSDILITHWNGMRDTAHSMQTEDRDVILLTNGVDRFSGTFKGIKDGNIAFRGTFDNDLSMPIGSVQEIRLASKKLRKLPEDEDSEDVRFYLQPFGRISGSPTADENGKTIIHSDILGKVTLDMKFVNIVDFSDKNSLLEFWDDNF